MAPARTSVHRYGWDALLVEVDGPMDEVHRLWRELARAHLAGVEDVVPGGDSVVLLLAPGRRPEDEELVRQHLGPSADRDGQPAAPYPPAAERPPLVLDVVYDGPDLAEVAGRCGLSVEEVVNRHQARLYTTDHLGFAPGFAYLSGGDPALAVPRRPSPRPVVPAGSLGLAGPLSGIYPRPTPGGWQLIGRTPARLFDPDRRPPGLLSAGDRVRFRSRPRGWKPEGRLTREGGRPLRPEVPGPGLRVLSLVGQLTFQDAGRPGWAHQGVPQAGWVDGPSALAANALVGNPPGAVVLEMTMGGASFRAEGGMTVAVTGADVQLRVAGRAVSHGRAVALPAGALLEVGLPDTGLRTYLAVAGGFRPTPVLGSASQDTLGGLGPPVPGPGSLLTVGEPLWPGLASPAGGRALRPVVRATRPPDPGRTLTLRVVPGPRAPRLGPAAWPKLLAGRWLVSAQSDRTGVLLDDGPVLSDPVPTVAPEGTVPGAVQVTGDGRPLVLLANRGPTGGYPVLAVVHPADLARLGQARPGQPVGFAPA